MTIKYIFKAIRFMLGVVNPELNKNNKDNIIIIWIENLKHIDIIYYPRKQMILTHRGKLDGCRRYY